MIYKETPIDTEDWRIAVEFASSNIRIHKIKKEYYFINDLTKIITINKIDAYQKCVEQKFCIKFEDYETCVSTITKVHLGNVNWRQGSCACLKIQKLYNYKHIVSIALREKMISVPEHLVCTFLQKISVG